ncbi:MAG: efflux RND transporter permease subunit, partial [Ekhidna sp.]|nr:efflux RND transporter permease subunit [Ekhidna sp.]
SELIDRTTSTITDNLVLGCLIVIFVVIVLLGDFRTGMIIASVIPISLFFAISLMYLFGIDANLMSLGAIDFGIIIDGSIIIVEFVIFQIQNKHPKLPLLPLAEQQPIINRVTFEGTSKMMHSAIFGQLIIIIVFIPILTLRGVEGKMFIPMALTFCFALLGAMLMCFTYVPVITSLLARAKKKENNWSMGLIGRLQNIYQPLLVWALKYHRAVLFFAIALLGFSGVLFSRLGGEFVPTLDEGDFVIQPVLPTGTSLSKTIEITTEIERVIKGFPEVDQVITRIGAAEIPTDPMSMEETDIIITLHPKSEWVSARSKDQLADQIKNRLTTTIADIDYEFTQPIEMRFNELITGVRADLAIKIFGEELDVLTQKAEEIEKLLQPIEGASDITVEKIEGLPQMLISYDRTKIARYGLNISDVNDLVTSGFAGRSAGVIFEGERMFDLVVRYGPDFRKELSDIKNATITNSAGVQIPLRELAEIQYTKGPAKISRDNTRRRIVVSINVRNRDLESVVTDVRAAIEENISLPIGYNITYGGQFENLRNAKERLAFAVPLALFLIFVMLFLAFQSIKDATLVFAAIPLAAMGGVFSLWITGLPFSISAGVGFIALFGIAVLNGIVLIEHYKSLMASGKYQCIKSAILAGTKQRLRPVLLTASTDALGFLPMALSTSAGAEVQRPEATVVIGG